MVSREDVKRAIPELDWIGDEKLREKVVDVWMYALNRGGWDKLEDVPFTLSFKNSGTLVDHTRRVARLVKNVALARGEDIDMDVLLAGALLHDVGKALEYERVGKEVKVSEYGKKERHPISGAKLARELGLPEKVTHIIESHSHEGDNMRRSKESIIVHHCDFIDFELRREESNGN